METLHLLRSPANPERLRRSIKGAEAEKAAVMGIPRELARQLDQSVEDLENDRISDLGEFLAEMRAKLAKYRKERRA
jgi:hypothetical protein